MANVNITDLPQSGYNQQNIVAALLQLQTQLNNLTEGRMAALHNSASVAPTTGSYGLGDFVPNVSPSVVSTVIPGVDASGVLAGWVNTSAGSPGTMTPAYWFTGSGAGVAAAVEVPIGTVLEYAGFSAPNSKFQMCYGQSLSATTFSTCFSALVRNSTVTMTIASPCVVTWASNTLQNNDPIFFTTTGALPTGLTAGTTYYVKSLSGNTFNVSATPGGTAINTSGSQSGTHTGVCAPYGCATDLSTFNVPDRRGRIGAGRDALGGTAANRITSGGSGINGDTPGASGGAETVSLTSAQNGAHTHSDTYTIASSTTPFQSNIKGVTAITGLTTSTTTSGSSGSGTAHNNMPPIYITNYIIRVQ